MALRLWGRMHGLVALEVYGHLRTSVDAAAKLHRAEIEAFMAELGVAE